ncbi:hypothetical protein CPB83DRAFT_839327 [Crepidotus variabilis]|uniref:Uncharacterized protein n=1 Tax=Crepidotus variabilis TaxID=179855 RepID=A0A9P6E7A7_9AGAR|nr:hypothetical protein CPB83DRAFT_839327 [Crepidotus variabilis]
MYTLSEPQGLRVRQTKKRTSFRISIAEDFQKSEKRAEYERREVDKSEPWDSEEKMRVGTMSLTDSKLRNRPDILEACTNSTHLPFYPSNQPLPDLILLTPTFFSASSNPAKICRSGRVAQGLYSIVHIPTPSSFLRSVPARHHSRPPAQPPPSEHHQKGFIFIRFRIKFAFDLSASGVGIRLGYWMSGYRILSVANEDGAARGGRNRIEIGCWVCKVGLGGDAGGVEVGVEVRCTVHVLMFKSRKKKM